MFRSQRASGGLGLWESWSQRQRDAGRSAACLRCVSTPALEEPAEGVCLGGNLREH